MSTFPYFPTIPNPPDDPADDVSLMQTNSGSISGLVAIDHVGFNVAGGGLHKQVTFNSNNPPSSPTTPPILFTNVQDGAGNALPGNLAQLFFYTGSNVASKNQYVSLANGSTMLPGGLILKWGNAGWADTSASQAITFSPAFPNNFFAAAILPNTTTPTQGVGSVSFNGTGSLAGFTAFRSNTTGGVTFFYIAIGN